MPAQFTKPRRLPKDWATAKAWRALSSRVTSVKTKRARSPSSAATDSPVWVLTSASTTQAPKPINRRAVAAPKPEPPPVTTNTWFSICIANPSS